VVIAIPSLSTVKGWHASHQLCDAGAIALLAQGDPPHSRSGRAAEAGAGRQLVL